MGGTEGDDTRVTPGWGMLPHLPLAHLKGQRGRALREAVPEHHGGQDAARAVVQPDVLLEVPLRGEALSCAGGNREMQGQGTAMHHALLLSHPQEHRWVRTGGMRHTCCHTQGSYAGCCPVSWACRRSSSLRAGVSFPTENPNGLEHQVLKFSVPKDFQKYFLTGKWYHLL